MNSRASILRTLESPGHDSPVSVSLPAILAAFIPSLITALVYLSIFVLIRQYYRIIYLPRTYVDFIPEKDHTPAGTVRFAWIKTLIKLGDEFILEHSSLDAYLYLRFLRTVIFICFIGACITWPILFPINATGHGDASQLDRLGFGNVRGTDRLYAHAVVAWIFFGFVMFVIARERMWLIGLRQAWYLSTPNAQRLSSRTVLYLDPPEGVSSDVDVQASFGDEAKRQWTVRSSSKLDAAVSSRYADALRLEQTQISFVKKATKKLSQRAMQNGAGASNVSEETIVSLRPVHRQYFVTGEKTDAISRLREHLKNAERAVEDQRKSYDAGDGSSRSAVFVEYSSQPAAQRAYRDSSHRLVPVPPNLAVQPRLIGVLPKEVLWNNLAMPSAERISKKSLANALIVALIVFWSIPSAFIGSISNVNYLTDKVEWLRWIRKLPDPILGLMSGLIPPFLTSLLASYVPIFMRYTARISGEPTTVSAELQVQAWYYAFQLIQVFLVTALSSSATAFVPKIIGEPQQIPMLLADSLPKSSNFYLAYFILQGLGSSADNILNYSDLFTYLFFDKFIYKTPREKYSQYTSLKGISWGKVYPKFVNFAIIALAYSCISPLVLGFATVGLVLLYLSYRHNLFFVIQPKIETKGKCYTRALQQILTGIYIGELCLIGLFGLRKAAGPSIMMAVLFLATIAYNAIMNRYLNPLEDHFPEELLASENGEEEPLLAAEEGEAAAQEAPRRSHRAPAPLHVVDRVAGFFQPRISSSRKAVAAFLGRSGSVPPSYTDEQLRTAYLNPSLTSRAPTIWLPRDELGPARRETEDNRAAGIESTDDGAWLDEHGRARFDEDDVRRLPVWSEPVLY